MVHDISLVATSSLVGQWLFYFGAGLLHCSSGVSIWETRASVAAVFRGLLPKNKVQQTSGLEIESDDGKKPANEEMDRKADTNEKVMKVA